MNCPYCNSPLTTTSVRTKSDQEGQVFECFNCGGHWFPRWLANDISLEQAVSVDAVVPKSTITPQDQPRCPICQTRLSLIKNDPVPRGIHVWSCPQGHGNFFPKGDLLSFKKAQEAKITYHSLWGIPLKSIFAVMLPVIAVIAIAGGIPLTLNELQKQQENRTKASTLYSRPIVTAISESSVIISLATKTPYLVSLSLYENDQTLREYPISTTAATQHQITLKDLSPFSTYTFTLTLTHPISGEKVVSESFPISLINSSYEY